jgi:hypothetical protein
MAYGKEASTQRDPISEDDLQRLAREFISSSLGGPDSEIASARERNIRAYNAEPVGDFAAPEIDDRSTFVSTDVADTVDGMTPQILDVFVSSDNALECEAKKPGPDSESAAKEATGYLNHLFYDRNDGLNVLHDWIQDAEIQKVGFVKVWAEEEKEDSKAEYEGQTEDQLAAVLADGAELAGDPQVDDAGMLTFTTTNKSTRMKFKVACVAPNKMRIDPNAKWGADPNAIGEVDQLPKFQLEEMGFDLSDVGSGWNSQDGQGEQDALLGPDGAGEVDGDLHESHRLYEYAELYFKLDVDGDGVAEWVQLCLINGNLLSNEKVDDHPYAEICLMPRSHAYFGDCPADRAYPIQREQTNLARAIIDNVYFATNQRNYVNTRANVNIDDILDNRPGGIVRGEGPPGEAFGAIPTQPINQTSWQLNEWLSVKLENRTGFTRYSQGLDSDSLNKTLGGIEIITQKADMRLRLMTRFAAQGIRKMFAKLLKLATRHQNGEDWFKVNGQWTPVNPFEWRDKFNIKINVGLGHGTKEQQAQRVMAMIPLQQMGLQVGVVRPEQIANTIRLFAEVNEFKNPEQFCDEAPTGMPPPEQFKQMQAEQQKQMQDLQGQLEQTQQENEQLKLANANKEGELALKARELDFKEDAAAVEFGEKVRATERAEQTQDADVQLEQDVAALSQHVAQLTELVISLLPQPQLPPDGIDMEVGADAPAAPIEGAPLE